MGGFSSHNLAFAFGLLVVQCMVGFVGTPPCNVISFFVFLSPLPTFYQIHKKKSTEGFQSVPYVVALFSALLLMYYAFLKTNATLLITINSFGCFIEIIFIGVFIFYAPKKIQTLKLLVSMIGGFAIILITTHYLVKSPMRVHVVGWICLLFSISVFAAPLCILKQVIRTNSVEFMPFFLSFSLTLNAVMWFFYGLLINDYNIAIPNVLGFFFGVVQMGLYAFYKNKTKKVMEEKIKPAEQLKNQVIVVEEEKKQPEVLAEQVIDIAKLTALMVCRETIPVVPIPKGCGITGDFCPTRPNMEIPVSV